MIDRRHREPPLGGVAIQGWQTPEISWIAWIASSQALLAMTDSKESIFKTPGIRRDGRNQENPICVHVRQQTLT
jgi:hypothetical protein